MIEYLPNFSGQMSGLLYSIGIGFVLGILYELIRIIFFILTGSDKKYVAVRDIIFLLLCFTVSFFFFIVRYNGKVTFYAVLGESIGGAVAFKSFDNAVSLLIKRVLRKVAKRMGVLFSRIRQLKCKFIKKIQNIKKKALFFKKN